MKEIYLVKFCNKIGMLNWARWVRSKIQTFDKHKLFFYRQFINEGDLCFDIGANIGQKIEIFLKLGAKVVAVEPQDACFHFLEKLYKGKNAVILVHAAIGAAKGKQEMTICESNAMSSLSSDWILKAQEIWKDHEWKNKEMVDVDTLDALIERWGTPHFIKIDVEGFELEVLKGLHRKIPYISFEITPITIPLLNEILENLKQYGEMRFNLAQDPTFSHGPIHFVFKEWVTGDTLSQYVKNNKTELFCDVFVKSH